MLAIKLRPTGKKHQRHFRLVVAEKKSKLGGAYVEDLGWLNPHENTFELRKEKVLLWLGRGAKPTPTVHNFLVKKGVLRGKKIPVHGRPKETAEKVG